MKSRSSKAEIKARLLEYRIRKTRELLSYFGVKSSSEVKIDEATGAPYLLCTFKLEQNSPSIKFHFPITKLGRRFIRELQRLDKACFCGLVDTNQVKHLFISLSTANIIHKYRSKLRKATGLIKDKKLRNYIIWRRLRAKSLIEKSER